MTYQQNISVVTKGHGDMHNLTDKVAAVVAASQVRTGIVHIFNVGSTASIGAIEFEPGLQKDLPTILDKLIPPAGIMATNRRGTTAMGIRTCRLPG